MPLTAEFSRTRHCPRCSSALKVQTLEEGRIDHCEKCDGVWVSHSEEKKVLEIKPEVFSIAELRRLPLVYKPAEQAPASRYVPCPHCQQLMNRKIWGSHSGVIVDVCRDHGTWFDAGKVEKIREYIRLGGIEYEKLRLAEKGINDLDYKFEREIRRLDRRFYTFRNFRLFDAMFNPKT